MSPTVTMKMKDWFFDRAAVVREVGRANAKALSKIGAFVRQRAKTSMRRRKAASPPGTPPSVHSNDSVATLRNIWFGYDRANQSVVIGPLKLNGQSVLSTGTVPELHEYGGKARIRTGRKGQQRFRAVTYPPRPFMGPALEAEAPKFPSLWVTSAGGRAAA